MNIEEEILHLQGEQMAVQTILTGLCICLVKTHPVGRALVEQGFSYAEAAAEAGAFKLGSEQPQTHLKAFMGTIEQLRSAALRSEGEPQGGV